MKFFAVFLMFFSSVTVVVHAEWTNVLVITADDLNRESLGCYGSPVADISPNIDTFAANGLKFTHAHVNNAICEPSRKVLASGLYGHNSGAMGFRSVNNDIVTILDRLKEEGYKLGCLGKLGHSSPKSSSQWDYAYDKGGLGGGRSPTLYYNRCKTFFDLCKTENKPFYFMVNSHDPHLPWYDPSKGTNHDGEEVPSKLYGPNDFPVPEHLPDTAGVRAELANFYNSIKRLDDTFGKVMQALDESGLRDNTLVLFIEDNGMPVPFAKANTYFASTRTPFIMQWPGVITPGGVNTSLVEEVDFFPTVLDALGLDSQWTDGQSLLPILQDPSQDTGRQYVYTQIEGLNSGVAYPMRCIQNRKYAYIYNLWSMDGRKYENANEKQVLAAMEDAAKTDPFVAQRIELFRYRVPEELYDVENDPGSLTNLIDSVAHQGVLTELRTAMRARMVECSDPILVAFDNRYDRDYARAVYADVYESFKFISKSKYNSWLNGHGLSGNAGAQTSDPDNDGQNNLWEYAFGSIPTDVNNVADVPAFRSRSDGTMEYIYRRRRDAENRGLHYDFSSRTNLTTGVWEASGYTETGTSIINSDFEWVTNSIPTDATNKFLRLKCIAW